jgi:serine/threonine protein phosphatase PrpC
MSEAQLLAPALAFVSAHRTHRGNVRRLNEDAVLDRSEAGLWMVADGMGGHEAGDHASQAIAAALHGIEFRPQHKLVDRIDVVEDVLLQVNARLHDYGETRFAGATVGSTVVVFIAAGDFGAALWAGDSRLYRFRAGRLEQVTRDHNPLSDLLDVGDVTEAEALTTDTNVITRAVGGHGPLHLDVVVFDLEAGDRFLLCSDGLYRELGQADIEARLEGELDDVADQLMRTCLNGVAQDNVSLVVVSALAG